MRRRAFLSSVGLAALAGCSTDGESTATPTATGTPTGTGSAAFELLSVEASDSIELNASNQFSIVVKNTGSGTGTFETPLETKTGDGSWQTAGTIDMSLSAGETGEWRSPELPSRYLTTLHYRLPEFDRSWSIDVTPKRLGFGKYYTTPTGLHLGILGGSFESEYPNPSNETATEYEATPTPTSPESGKTWLVLVIEVQNGVKQSQPTPDASEFVLKVNGEKQPQHQEVSDNPYHSGSLAGRTIRRGDLVYAVPEGTSVEDITLSWANSYPNGDVKAIWTR